MWVSVQATQQMEVKAFSMTNSLWPTWTRSEHLVVTHTHVHTHTHTHTVSHMDLNRLYSLDNNKWDWIISRCSVIQEYFLPVNSYGHDQLHEAISGVMMGMMGKKMVKRRGHLSHRKSHRFICNKLQMISDPSCTAERTDNLLTSSTFSQSHCAITSIHDKLFPHWNEESFHRTTKARTGVFFFLFVFLFGTRSCKNSKWIFKDTGLTAPKSSFRLSELC